MDNRFDELTKELARSVTRRGALRKFGVGLVGIALAVLGLAKKAVADPPPCLPPGHQCGSSGQCKNRCCSGSYYSDWSDAKKSINICN